jgi:hypothetical protein
MIESALKMSTYSNRARTAFISRATVITARSMLSVRSALSDATTAFILLVALLQLRAVAEHTCRPQWQSLWHPMQQRTTL